MTEPEEQQNPSSSGKLIQLDASESATPAVSQRRRRTRMPSLSVLPTMLTLGNAVCGVAALIELTKVFAATAAGNTAEVYVRLGYAVLLIGAGMLFDGLDGKVARMTNTTGRFGAELDSLCDAVTFGVVPALMIRVSGEFFFASYSYDSKVLWAVSALYLSCVLLRLARFNVETEDADDHTTFQGLPSPAGAASIAAVVMGAVWLHENVDAVRDSSVWEWIFRFVIPATGIIIGIMMTSRVRYSHVFNRFLSRRHNLRTLVVLMLFATTFWIFSDYWMLIIPVLMMTYVLSGPSYLGYRFVRGRGLLGRRMALSEKKRLRTESK
ncbi:phosphatidylcholine/phosphatidylserine synthase [Planctomycetota bacterium]|nr:phosphatidylcholine/phosphatidylserine synthase [Planctomycetota bacterium]